MNFQQSYFSYVAEVTPGTTPETPTMKKLRTTNPLQATANKALLESEEVLSHRSEEHVRHGMKGFQGSAPTELSFGAFDDFLAALVSGSWNAGVLKVGTTVQTFTVEQKIGASTFIHGLGVTPTQLQLSATPTGLVTANWDLIGMDFESAGSTLGAPEDVATHAPFDGLGNAVLKEGGSVTAIITSLDMSINAGKTVGGILGSNAGDTPSDGQLQISGTITARFNSLALFQKFENETGSSLQFTFKNPDNTDDTLDFLLPNLKYISGQPQNNDNVIDGAFQFRALYDSDAASPIVITATEGS